MLKVAVNGEERTLDDGATVGSLLGSLGVQGDGLAVAVNARVVRASDFEGHALREGDEVEIIRAVAGG